MDDLVAFLQSIDAAPAHLVGNSWGALISLLTAIRHPEVVRSLVLEEPPATSLVGLSIPPRASEFVSLLLRHPRLALTIAMLAASTLPKLQRALNGDDDEALVSVFATAAVGAERYQQLDESRRQRLVANARALRAQLTGAGLPPMSADQVRGVAVPTLVLTGRESPAIARLLDDHLEGLLPNRKRVFIPDASHDMHEGNPSAVNDAILSFLP